MTRAEVAAIRQRFVDGEMPDWQDVLNLLVAVKVLQDELDAERESHRLSVDCGLRPW